MMPRSGKIIIKDLLLLDYRRWWFSTKFNGIDYSSIITLSTTLSIFRTAPCVISELYYNGLSGIMFHGLLLVGNRDLNVYSG